MCKGIRVDWTTLLLGAVMGLALGSVYMNEI